MNSKLIKASLAGVAAIGLAAGGGTFAAWSDFQTQGAAAGAGYMRLNLINDHQGTDTNVVQPLALAPGQHKTQNFYLASADSGNTPTGKVTAYIDNLTDTEDTPPGTCTSNSESVAEGSSNCAANGGELSSQAVVEVSELANVSTPAACDHWDTVPTNGRGHTLAQLAGPTATVFDLGNVAAGQGVCLIVEVSLPTTATNAVQGDDASWNWHFDLTQI